MDSDRSRLTPHQRKHWSVEPAAQPEAPHDDLLSPEESRVEAKRLLGRDSAIILVGIVLALLVAQFLPGMAPGLTADETSSASGSGFGGGGTLAPESSTPAGATLGPVVDPSLGIDATRPPVTLPPTGTFKPVETDDRTPRPTKRPPATIAPPTPAPTPTPTPEITPAPEPPAAGFSWSATLLVVQFNDASTGEIESWEWDFGDGTASNDQNPSHLYLDAGEYLVRLRVTGPGGSASFEATVIVSLA